MILVIPTQYAILVQFSNTNKMKLHRAGPINYFFVPFIKNTPVYTVIPQFFTKMSSKIDFWFYDLPKVETNFWS